MGHLSLYLTTTLFGVAVQGLAFAQPRATDKVIIPLDAQSPRPTPPPAYHELLRRQSGPSSRTVIEADNVCGYFSGRPGAPLSCIGTDHSCVFFPATANLDGFRACCADETGCGAVLNCLDIEEVSSRCDNGCLMDTFTLKCTETALPYCNTVRYFGGITDYFCGSLAISSAQFVETTYSGQTGRTLRTTTIDLSPSTSSSFILVPESSTTEPGPSSSTPNPPPSSTTPIPPPPSSPPPPSKKKSSTPIAPIVGGVVGGVAVIGLVVLGVILLMKRRSPKPAPAQPAPQMAYAPPPQTTGSPPPQPPADVKYGQDPMVGYAAVPPPNNNNNYNNTQNYQPPVYQQQYSPQPGQGGFIPSQQQTPTDPNRISIAPPASPVSSLNSQQPGQYQHLSQQSFSQQPGPQPFQPGNTTNNMYPSSPPPDVYEVGNNVVGGQTDYNADHRGQIHQLQ